MVNKVLNIISNIIKDLIYFISFLFPRNKNLWLFGAWFAEKYADNGKYLFEYVNKNHPEIRAVWLTKNKYAYELVKEQGHEVYYKNSLKAHYLNLTAAVGVITTGTPDIIDYTTGRMKIVNLWHGTPLKKLWFDYDEWVATYNKLISRIVYTLYPYLKKDFSPSNLYITTSEEVQNKIATSFQVPPDRIKITGYPRNDALYKIHNSEFNNRILDLKENGCKIGIFMPTHRDGVDIQSYFTDFFESLDHLLNDLNVVILIKLHFYNQKELDHQKFKNLIFIDDFDIKQDIYQLISVSDFLITDYSSIYFDYLLLNKPIIFTPFDLEEYSKTRGLYYDYNKITPGPKADSSNSLIMNIKDLSNGIDNFKTERNTINKCFNKFNDPNNSKRVYSEITDFLNS